MASRRTIVFENKPVITGSYSIVGPKEGKGNFASYFDYIMNDDSFGEKTYEKAEKKMLEHAINGAVADAKIQPEEVSLLLSGDLLNQIISSSYAARNFDVGFLGLFGACSTMAEGLAIGSAMVDSGYFDHVVCATGSHFSTAERQFRFPLELGNQRPPTSQWTVTGAGACVLSKQGSGPRVAMATFGKVIDYAVVDVNDMGAAMAPAAMDTMLTHFRETNSSPDDYDLIVTGDLGKLGSEILIDLMEMSGIKLGLNYNDCGQMYFTRNQNTLSGGSGCGCSATVLNSYIISKLRKGELQRVLFMPTGALMSTTASQQGETIPGVCHAIVLESDVKPKGGGVQSQDIKKTTSASKGGSKIQKRKGG
ncbi:MAG: stage V sporulation protein AD [Clostridia bacterium]|nr:stage V sporulation protein AD [Clostridia bacterium]